MLNRNIFFVACTVLALVVIVGIVSVASRSAHSPEQNVATSTSGDAASTAKGDYTIEQVPLPTLESLMPNLGHAIAFGASVPSDARVVLQKSIDAVTTRLTKDPTSAADWYNLAIYYHEADDFDAAAAVWKFLVRVLPNNSLAYENLGKLYHFDLKDYPKAESYFTQAIAINQNNWDLYNELYELYVYSYKQGGSAAVDILNKAAAALPTSSAPYFTLGTYYRDKGDAADARAAFEKAMDRARSTGDVNAMNLIGAELSKLSTQ